MSKVTGKDIINGLKKKRENSAQSEVQSSSVSNRITGQDIVNGLQKRRESANANQVQESTQGTTTMQNIYALDNVSYAQKRLDSLNEDQKNAVENYNKYVDIYMSEMINLSVNPLLEANNTVSYLNEAIKYRNESGLSAEEFDSYAKNWESYKDIVKNEAYQTKSTEKLSSLSDAQREEINQYNLSMELYESALMQKATMNIDLDMSTYYDAMNYKNKFMEEYDIDEDEFNKLAQYAKESKDKASMEESIQNIQEDIKENPVAYGTLYSALDLASSPFTGLLALGETFKSLGYADKEAPINTNSSLYALQNIGTAIEQQISEEIENPVGSFVYNVGMSTGKSVLGAALGTKPLSLAVFGTSAYSSALKNAQDRGISKERAMLTALGAGAAEIVFEQYSLDHLYDLYKTAGKTALKDTIKNVFVQSGIEGSEEVFTELSNIITDGVINGDFSEYGMNVRNYQAAGLSEEEARKQANVDVALQVAEAGLAGVISGGIMGGGTTIASKINYANLGKTVNQDTETKEKIVEAAKMMNDETTAKKIVVNTKTEDITDAQMSEVLESMADVDANMISRVFSEVAPVQTNAQKNTLESNKRVSTTEDALMKHFDDTKQRNVTEEQQIETVSAMDIASKVAEQNRNYGVTQAIMTSTNEPVIAVKFDEVSKDKVTVKLANDTVVPLEEVQMNTRTMQNLYNVAATMNNTEAANAVLNNYKGQPLTVYAQSCAVFYNAGQLKTASFDELVQNPKNASLIAGMGDTATLYEMFSLGRNSVENIAPVQQTATIKKEKTEGKVIDNRTDKSDSRLYDLYEMVAKRTGLDLELSDSLEHGERGHFSAALGRIALSNKPDNQYEVLVHELMEYASTYNSEKMQEVYDMVLSYAMSDMGAKNLTETIKAYKDAYEKVEHGKTYQSASEEFVNDYLAGVFSTEEGIRDFVDFMTKENVSVEQQRSILQTVADFFKDIVNKISQYIDEHVLSDAAKMGLRADVQQAKQMRQMVLDVLEDTIGSGNVPVEEKYSLSLKEYSDHQKKNWKNSENIIVYQSEEQLSDFVNKALNDNTYNKKMHFGMIPSDTALRVKNETGIIVDGFNVVLYGSEVRKIIRNSHGDSQNESARGQRVITKEDIMNIPEVVGNPDEIVRSDRQYEGHDVIKFIKTINGRETVVTYVQTKKHDIRVQTMYAGVNKKSLATTPGDTNIFPQTSKTLSGTASNNIIAQSSKNTTKKLSDIKLSLDVDLMSILEEEYSQEENESASIIEEGFASLQNVTVDKKTMHKLAYRLKKDYKSAYSIEDLTDNLTNVFAYLKDHPDAKYQDMVRIMSEVARPVIEESTDVDTWEKAMYDNFRNYFKGKTIKLDKLQREEVAHYYGSFENFRRKNFGSIQFSATNGTSLDSMWREIVQQSDYMLEEDTVSPEQPIALMDMMNALKPVKRNIYGMNTEQASYDLALDIFRQFFVEQAQEKANEQVRKKSLRLIERQQDYRKRVHKEFEEAKTRIREYDKEKRDNMRREYEIKLKDARASMRSAVKDHDKEAAKKYADMEKFYQEQIRLINQEANEKVVAIKAANRQNMANRRAYEEQKRVRERITRNAKSIINYFNTNTDKRHIPEALKTPIAQFITSIDFISERANPNSAASLAWQDSLNLMYRRLTDKKQAIEQGYEDIFAILNGENGAGDVLRDMTDFLDHCSGKRVTDLTVRELEQLDGIITALKRAITDINRLYVNKRTQNVAELGKQSITELQEKKDKKAHSYLVEKGINIMDANMLDSRSYFDRLGEAAFSIYDELRTAFNQRVWKLKEAQDHMTKALEGLDVKLWTGENAKVHDFLINGQHLQMTTAQIMSLYELNKRNQAKLHMVVGGIRPTVIGKGAKQIKRVKPVKLTSKDIDTICNALTKEQKEVADKIQEFLGTNCAKWGNEASMQMYGYERFGAKNYFPIRTDGNTVDTKDESKFWATKNQGFTKETVKNASNPLVVSDIFEVFTKHVTDMASYSTYSVALMDAMKWYNFRSTDLQGDVVVYDDSVKTEIERAYGDTYLKYFTKLIEDINAENKRGIESEIAELLTSNMKAASVGANLRVVIQQPTAYLRAAAVIDPKYLGKAVFKKSAMKKAKEHSAITLWKSWGYFETSIGRSMQNVLTNQKTKKEWLVDKSMAMAQYMDDFTWGYLWNACEHEISDKYKKVKYDSPEYLKLVSERFDEVVDQTQVVDTVLHKSHIMRSKNMFDKMVTSFMSEPTKSYNLLMNRIRDLYEAKPEGKKKAKKALTRAVNAYVVTQILNAAVVSIVDAYRDWKDDEKTFWEKYFANFKENLVDNMNPLSMIPYAKDLVSIVQGYDVARQDMQGISTLVNGGRKIGKYITDEEYRSKNTLWDVTKELIKGGSQVLGAPAYNPLRDVEAIWNTYFPDLRIGGRIYTKTEDYNNMLDALLEDNTEAYNKAYSDLIEKGMEESEIPGKIVLAAKERYETGELSASEITNLLINDLGYDSNEAWFKVNREWEYGSKYGLLYENINAAYEGASRTSIQSEINELTSHGTETSDIASGITRKYKEQYLELLEQNKAANMKNLLITCYMYCGYTREEAMEKIEKWSE